MCRRAHTHVERGRQQLKGEKARENALTTDSSASMQAVIAAMKRWLEPKGLALTDCRARDRKIVSRPRSRIALASHSSSRSLKTSDRSIASPAPRVGFQVHSRFENSQRCIPDTEIRRSTPLPFMNR